MTLYYILFIEAKHIENVLSRLNNIYNHKTFFNDYGGVLFGFLYNDLNYDLKVQ